MHSLGPFTCSDISLASLRVSTLLFSWALETGRKQSSFSSQWPFWLGSMWVTTKGQRRQKSRAVWLGIILLSVCHYSIVTLPVDGPQPPDLERADFPGLVVLNLSKIHLFYQKFSKSVSQLLVPRLQMNHTSTFNYQEFPVEEENSD